MKFRVVNYTFDASEQTVDFDDVAAIALEAVLLIVNVTDQIIIYNFADSAKGGTAAGNTLTLEHDTTAMADGDDLLIYYDDGEAEHDDADVGTPTKIGGKAIDYEPDTEDAQGAAAVAANDRANAAFNLRGERIEGVNSMYHLFNGAFPDTGLDGIYEPGATISTSEAVECWNYRWATVGFSIDSTSTPTDFQVFVQVTADGTNYMNLTNGPLGSWVYDDTVCATAILEAFTFPICAYKIRVKMVALGTDGSKKFTIDHSYIQLRN